jgi:ligand-binding sensor domain-containing protein
MKTVFLPAGRRFVPFFVVVAAVMHGMGVHAASITEKTFISKNSRISTMVCDGHSIWGGIGMEGLMRIDKITGETSVRSFATRGLPYNSITALAFDNDSALLVGTSASGILRFNGSRWERLPGLSDSVVWRMSVDGEGKIWVWTPNLGIVYLDAGVCKQVVNRFTGALTRDPGGNEWIMNLPSEDNSDCGDAWIREYDNGALQSSVSLTSICPERSYSQSLAVDSKKNCWIGALDKLIKVTGQSIRTFVANADTASRTYCSVLAVNRDDVLLIAAKTYVSGYFSATKIFLYDQGNGNASPFDSAVLTYSGNYTDAVGCADDREGCFWLAASNGSIVRIDASSPVMSILTRRNSVLPGNSIASLLIDKADNVWAATSSGIARCIDTSWTLYPAAGDSFPGNDACCLAMDSSGTIWAGFRQPMVSSMSSTGISCFGGQYWRMLFRSHFSQKAIAVDKAGDQWVVSEDGISRYHEGKAEKVYITPGAGGYDTSMNAIAIDGNNIPWLGTDQGLKKYVNGVWADDTSFNRLCTKSEATGAHPVMEVTSICFHGNTAWIGTAVGLFKRIGSDCTRIDTAGGLLPDPYVQCIVADGVDNAWVGTRRGLVRLNGQHHTTYTTDNTPLCDNDITACAVARSGDVWIGTRRGGLTVLREASLTEVNDIVPIGNRGPRPIDISFRAMRHGAFRISIWTNSPAAINMSVFSPLGKLVKRLDAAPAGAQSVVFTWDGTDYFNCPVSAGVYPCIVTGNGKFIGSTVLRQ